MNADDSTGGAAPSSSLTIRTPTDTVFYSIFPDDDHLSLPSLHSLHLQILSLLHSFIPPSYIFHHSPFHLSPSLSPFPHLAGASRFGDNLDDEWLIAAFLFRLSSLIPVLSVSLSDSDGHFLLIEAAFHLPKNLTPATSLNRVFIRNGLLHILPLDEEFPHPLRLETALSALKSGRVQTVASDSVQAVIKKRIDQYPEKAVRNMHRVRVRVPLPVAQVLKEEPCLISLAVEGFYDRDVDSMKHAMRMEKFLKEREEVEMVRMVVTMTRAMYGQLVMQRFQAPKGYPMPGVGSVGREEYGEWEVGMKIACGFEMMYGERKRMGEEGRGGSWDVFLRSLEGSGVFDGLLPGSKEYKRILDGATEYYQKSSLFSRTRDMMNAPVRRIDEILALPHSADEFNSRELPPSDDDSWLYDGEDELNSAISERQKELEAYESKKNKKSGEQELKRSNFRGSSDDFDFDDIAYSMQAFVNKLSSFEGAEIPQNSNSNDVELDVNRFVKEMESVIGAFRPDEAVNDAVVEEGSTSSSEMHFDDSDCGSDIEQFGGDDKGDTFMESYSDVLNEELNATTLKRSFIHASQQLPNNNDEGTSSASKDIDEELTPVDVDVNLVKSFLDSYSSQGGLPGPASNLLGLMGLNIPQDADRK